MTRRTDPIFEVLKANDAFGSTPSEEEMQQIWDLIGPLMERYLRLRPIWQVAGGAFIEGFETGALKRLMWYGEGPFPIRREWRATGASLLMCFMYGALV